MLLAHKIALDPKKHQCAYFVQAAGTARFAWNWALAEWKRQYTAGEKPSEISLRKQLNAIKRVKYPWMYNVTKCAAQEAIIDLGASFRAFFEKRGKHPRFKKKEGRESFCAANECDTFRTQGKRIKLPIVGWVAMREEVRFRGPLKRATISCESGRWFVSILVDTHVEGVDQPNNAVGVDLGVKALATLSNGESVEGPKAHKRALKQLRRAHKNLSRKKRGSANFYKQKRRLSRIYTRIKNVRKDSLHKLTTRLSKGFRIIGIEDLNVRGMVKNSRLSRAISDMGFAEFRRQLEYKCRMYGSLLVVVDRWFPSSKTCSCCGVVKSTLGWDRTFRCNCGFEADRDLNAAKNLENEAASLAVNACGEVRAGAVRKCRVKRSSMKQEELLDMTNSIRFV